VMKASRNNPSLANSPHPITILFVSSRALVVVGLVVVDLMVPIQHLFRCQVMKGNGMWVATRNPRLPRRLARRFVRFSKAFKIVNGWIVHDARHLHVKMIAPHTILCVVGPNILIGHDDAQRLIFGRLGIAQRVGRRHDLDETLQIGDIHGVSGTSILMVHHGLVLGDGLEIALTKGPIRAMIEIGILVDQVAIAWRRIAATDNKRRHRGAHIVVSWQGRQVSF
jgi:hypothetical protein